MRCVQEGNCMAWRCALLCFLALARGIWVVLEQPKGSLLEAHPAMQALFKTCFFGENPSEWVTLRLPVRRTPGCIQVRSSISHDNNFALEWGFQNQWGPNLA